MRHGLFALLLVVACCGPKDWRRAKREGTADAYRAIAAGAMHPKRTKTQARAEALDWEAAERSGSSRAWKAFLSHHPASARAAEARARLDEASWEEVRRADNLVRYEAWLADHLGSPHAPEARERIDALLWAAAEESGKEEDYEHYLVRLPRGTHAAEARKRLDDLRWERASQSDTPAAYQAYLNDHPHGAHVDEARARLDGMRFRGLSIRIVGRRLLDPSSLRTYRQQLTGSLLEGLRARGIEVRWLDLVDATDGRLADPFAGMGLRPEGYGALVLEVEERPGRPYAPDGRGTFIDATVHLVPPGREVPIVTTRVKVHTGEEVLEPGPNALHLDAQRRLGEAVLEADLELDRWRR